MKKYVTVLFLLILFGCSATRVDVAIIRIKGSDTMLLLTQMLAEEYMRNNPGVSIYVEGGGTSSGVKSLIRGEIDICTASRTLKADEAKSLADYYGTLGVFYLIAKDALSIYVNPDNPVRDISIENLRKIYTCKIKNWHELGGLNQEVLPVIRNPNSGTHAYFKEHVLGGSEYCTSIMVEPTTESVIETVSENENAIGYGGIGYGEDIVHISIDGIAPTEENARNDRYPITRYLHFFTSRTPTGPVKSFIDWVLTPEGQAIIKEAGFIPLWKLST